MDLESREPEPVQQRGDHIAAIIAKSIVIAAVLTGAAWTATASLFKYF